MLGHSPHHSNKTEERDCFLSDVFDVRRGVSLLKKYTEEYTLRGDATFSVTHL